MNAHKKDMKLDIGADVTVIPPPVPKCQASPITKHDNEVTCGSL